MVFVSTQNYFPGNLGFDEGPIYFHTGFDSRSSSIFINASYIIANELLGRVGSRRYGKDNISWST